MAEELNKLDGSHDEQIAAIQEWMLRADNQAFFDEEERNKEQNK